MNRPKNVQAILDYVDRNAPEELHRLLQQVFNAADPISISIASMLLMSFEAGRQFQVENPHVPHGPGDHYRL
jgi:hypothetical protein